MLTPDELREESRRYRMAALGETDPHLRRTLANHALAMAQLAEKTERAAGGSKVPETRMRPRSE